MCFLSKGEIVEVIGQSKAALLLGAYGGGRVCFTESGKDSHAIMALIGKGAFRMLCKAFFSLSSVELPMDTYARRMVRDRAVMQDVGKGMVTREICHKYDISPRTVRTIKQRAYTGSFSAG